ncbi:hypothetical protein VM1G_11563 [Cytospora mali]|uniref:Uncharacterized protein n=1 Tax=Cytospora mali TaxID=578113 RepID=A0A194VXH1_CYTMA|nr:hypothetical protein VM1G_11563 [Valsa mali]
MCTPSESGESEPQTMIEIVQRGQSHLGDPVTTTKEPRAGSWQTDDWQLAAGDWRLATGN